MSTGVKARCKRCFDILVMNNTDAERKCTIITALCLDTRKGYRQLEKEYVIFRGGRSSTIVSHSYFQKRLYSLMSTVYISVTVFLHNDSCAV